jgi:thioredoxin 1
VKIAQKQVTDENFEVAVLEAEQPVVVDFWAAWCPPCRAMEPILAQLALEHPELEFVKLEADANHQTVIAHGVLAMPTLIVFAHGREVARLVGARSRRRLEQELTEALERVAAVS